MSANKSTSITSMGQVVLLLLSMFCGSCDWNRSRFVPSELIGVWKTDDVRYRGRSLELSVDTALIETGSDEPGTEAVESVKIQPTGAETTYLIRCRASDGTRHMLSLRFSSRGGGEIRLSHPDRVVWKRQDELDTAPRRHHRARLVPTTPYKIDCLDPKCSGD
jgi:hypothetical protein